LVSPQERAARPHWFSLQSFPRLVWSCSWLNFALLFFVAFQVGGCAGKEVNPDDPASLMEDAEADIKSDHFQIAIDKLRMIKSRFPYSKQAAVAQLRIGDVFFKQEAFGEAAASYEAFRDLYPKHEQVGYAIIQIGKSFESDIPDNPERDMASANHAIEAYEEYLKRFPKAEQANTAKEAIHAIRDRLASKELAIARFYIQQKQYSSARSRLRKTIQLYPESASAKIAQEEETRISSLGNK
jgi:outer membrane assembly lipoprotein YfiO